MAHIVIATPLYRNEVHLHFMTSVMELTQDLSKHDHTVNFVCCQGADIATNRNVLCKIAVEQNADYILFCDSDMSFPSDIVRKMIDTGKGCIGASACARGFEYPLGAVGYDRPNLSLEELLAYHTKPNYTSVSGQLPNCDEAIEVSRMGTGVMLIAIPVLRDLLDRQIVPLYHSHQYRDIPLFFKFDHSLLDKGEDYVFCHTLRNAGHQVYVFGTNGVLHYGEYSYRRALPNSRIMSA